jgi:hypothetical protein
MPPTRRRLLWIIPALVAVHNVEEGLTFGRYLPSVRVRLPALVRPFAAAASEPQLLFALAAATLVPLAVAIWAHLRPTSRVALWSALLVQAVLLLNVAWHLAAALLLRGYAPGLITAVALNLPFSVYLLRRATREQWLSRRFLVALLPAAIVVHGPLLLALLLLSRAVVARR